MAGLLDGMTPQQYGLLAAGLGMMGNSRGRSLGESLSAGGIQGLNAMAGMQQAQQEQEQAAQMQQMQQYRFQQMMEQDARERQLRNSFKGVDLSNNDAIYRVLADNGMYEDLLKLKKQNQVDPYFTTTPTRDGRLIKTNARTGESAYVDINGNPVYSAAQDPITQGNIQYERTRNKFETVEGPDGAKQSGLTGSLLNMPPKGRQPTVEMTPDDEAWLRQAATQNDDPKLKAWAQGEAQKLGVITGLTPGQETTQKETAKNAVEMNTEQTKREVSAKRMLELLNSPIEGQSIKNLILKSTGSGLGNIVDKGARFFGSATDGAKAMGSLRTLQGWLTSGVPRMQGPQSDKDTDMYKEMAGKIADPTIPADEKLSSYDTLVEIMTRQAKLEEKSADDDLVNKYLNMGGNNGK